MSEEKIKYRFSNDPTGTHIIIADYIRHDSKVLDIGCSAGYLGEYLARSKGCEMWGVEPDKNSYVEALNKGYTTIVNKNVEDGLSDLLIENQKFDYIILADVLEHLVSPESVLVLIRTYLREGGKVLISTPNIAHYSIRRSLLLGRWETTDWGILDRTHLHFYTLATLEKLFINAGWVVSSVRPRGDLERWFRKFGLEFLGKKILFYWPEFFAVQFIFVLKVK